LAVATGTTGGSEMAPLSPEEWAAAKERLGGWRPAEPGGGATEDHRAALRDGERIGSVRARLWHLNALVAADPDDWTLYARRAEAATGSRSPGPTCWPAAAAGRRRRSCSPGGRGCARPTTAPWPCSPRGTPSPTAPCAGGSPPASARTRAPRSPPRPRGAS